MSEDKLMPLALEMTKKLKQRQEHHLAKNKRLSSQTDELEDKLREFEGQRSAIS
jgi:hypothetical protein